MHRDRKAARQPAAANASLAAPPKNSSMSQLQAEEGARTAESGAAVPSGDACGDIPAPQVNRSQDLYAWIVPDWVHHIIPSQTIERR